MSNVPLMFQALVKYADFQGRARRSEFWLWVLFRILLGMVTAILVACLIVPGLSTLHDTSDMSEIHQLMFTRIMPFVGLIGLVNLALLIPTLAVGVRRLHDTNRSGWWIILPHVVAFAGAIVFMISAGGWLIEGFSRTIPEEEAVAFIFKALGTALLTIYLPTFIAGVIVLIFYVTDGTAGPNRFGSDPKGRGEPAPSAPMSLADVPEEMH